MTTARKRVIPSAAKDLQHFHQNGINPLFRDTLAMRGGGSMGGKPTDSERKRAMGERLWLLYYNEALFQAGMITEDERNRMVNRIDARCSQLLAGGIR